MSTTVELHRVKAELAALRARVEALANELDDQFCEWDCPYEHAQAVRNLLDADA